MLPVIEYSVYTDIYKGSIISQDEWQTYSREALEFINGLCASSLLIANLNESQTKLVEYAVCSLSEYLKKDEIRVEKAKVSSESVANHSRSYNVGAFDKKKEDIEREKKQLVYGYLLPTNLLYRGVGCSHM